MSSKEEIREKLQGLVFEEGFEWVNEIVDNINVLLYDLIDENDCEECEDQGLDNYTQEELHDFVNNGDYLVIDVSDGDYLNKLPLKGFDTLDNQNKIEALNEVGLDNIRAEDLEKFLKAPNKMKQVINLQEQLKDSNDRIRELEDAIQELNNSI